MKIFDIIIDGTATIAWKADAKIREFMQCPRKQETIEFAEAYAEFLHHVTHCHVCRGEVAKALNAIPKVKVKQISG